MRLRTPTIWMVTSALAALTLAPRVGRGNPVVVDFCLLNAEGASSHVLPRGSTDVTMAAEHVVLVPYWDRRTKRAQVLVHAWYDLVSDRAQRGVRVGFPEVKGAYRYFMARENDSGAGILKLRQPTIWRFRAALAGRRLKVAEHPGVARYRRWFTFGVNLPARRKVRLDLLYVSGIGRRLRVDYSSGMGMPDSPRTLRQSAEYWIDYVLHTGGKWKRPIRRGEVVLYYGGRRHVLKRFANLRPTRKDDLTVRLALGRLVMPVDNDSNTDAMMSVQDWEKQERPDTLPLVQQSSVLPGARAEGLGALAVDGDKATGWISAAGKARGAWLQLPADPGRALGAIHLTGLTRAGVARPKQVEVRCLRRRRGKVRSRRLTTATLPAGAGPHRIRIGAARGCAAVRLVVRSVHGQGARSVGIAEVAQLYGSKPKGAPKGVKVVRCCYPAKGKPRRALSLAHKALTKLPKARAGWGWEIARMSDVRWSADGTLVHYRLWLENEHRDPRALLLGTFVEVATGRVLRRYRLDRAGTLGKAERAAWQRAMPFVAAHRLLKRHGFVAARLQRQDPSPRGKRRTLALRGTLPAVSGRLKVRSLRTGFAWRFEPNLASRVQARSMGTLRLTATAQGPGGKTPTPLATSRPHLDHALARLHHRVRQRRRKLVDKNLREHHQVFGAQGSAQKRPKSGPIFYRLFPRVHAFSGDVVLHWHPQGRAVLAAWTDVRELTALLPDTLLDRLTFDGTKPNPWERLDYGRTRAWVSVHALAPTQRTKLLRSPVLTAATPWAGQPTAPGSTRARTAAPRARTGPPSVTRPHTGCGCGTGRTGRPGLWVMLLLALLMSALGHRLRTR